MPYRLDLARLRAPELRRSLPPAQYLAASPALGVARVLGRHVFAPDLYPEKLELRVAEEADWDALGASLEHVAALRSMRELLHGMGFVQVGAFCLKDMPYRRNFFAYTKTPDVLGAAYLGDATGVPPHLELMTIFREPRDGRLGLFSSNILSPDVLDPSEHIVWQSAPGLSAEGLFQLHRGKVLELGKANRPMRSAQEFMGGYLDLWNENYRAWLARRVLVLEDA